QKTYYGSIGGELFDLPGGAFAFSLGAEHREESGFDGPDALINSGDTTGNARTATDGSYKLDEAYLELAIPLLSGVTGAQLLDFSVATRFSDYSNFGNTTNSKFGFRWKPINDLMIRGNWSQGFRAPTISELFSGISDTFEDVADPCAGVQTGNPNTPPASCAGVPAYNQSNSQIRTTTGGNQNLGPETSTSKTLGFVYSPTFAPGLDVSVDWWNIKIEGAIYAQTAQQTLDSCYIQGVGSQCDLIERDSTGQISNLLAVPSNVGTMEVEGWDVTLGYRLPDTTYGSFSFVLDTAYTSKYTIEDPVTQGYNRVGNYLSRDNYWRVRSNLMVAWQLGDFGATASARYYSSQNENCTGTAFGGANLALLCADRDHVGIGGKPDPQRKIASVTYTDL
ncbi:MAG: TonB-dependent receptor domain-containing protein, partial [Stenotrophomonas sp.]